MLIGHTIKSGEPVAIEPRDLARHVYVAGGTGTGKSSLLVNIVLQQAESGAGLAFIDPHGDASQASSIGSQRARRSSTSTRQIRPLPSASIRSTALTLRSAP